MRVRWTILSVSALIIAGVVTGCGGGIIESLVSLLRAGDVISDVYHLLAGDPPDQFTVLLDGQPIPVTPAADGSLQLNGVPAGEHLLQVVAPNKNRGGVTIIDVRADSRVDVGAPTEVVGGRILGKVRLGSAGVYAAARRVLVVAIPGGATAVQKGKAAPITIPPRTTYYATYTDGNGDYELNAVDVGDYLVTAAVPGYQSDVKAVNIPAQGHAARGVNLDLERDTTMPSGVVTGRVRGAIIGGTQALAGAALKLQPTVPFEPTIKQDAINDIAAAAGFELMDSPWFSWTWLGMLTDLAGSYEGRAPVGSARLSCFAYGYQPVYQDIAMINNGSIHSVFDLNPR